MKINRILRCRGKWLISFTVSGKRREAIGRDLGETINMAFKMARWEV